MFRFLRRASLTHLLLPRGPVARLVSCVCAGMVQLLAFSTTPVINRVYDGWPRGWLVHLVAIFAAFLGGVWPGLTAEGVGVGAIWWKGRYFTPMHPGLEVFAAIGILQILIIHQLQIAHRRLTRRQHALERARRQADDARRLAQQANTAKDQFLATLSHELRTPLTVILGYCEFVHRVPGHDQARINAIIERNALAQLRIVEDLLDVQRLLRGDLKVEHRAVDLRAEAAAVLDALQPEAVDRCVSITQEIEPATVDGDATRLRQVVWNLLSNAIKFSPPGGRVALTIRRDRTLVVLRVENTGERIPVEFLPHLFDPFRQADMSTTRAHSGLGLGLAITKCVVDLHQGSIDVTSDDTRTVFTVRLPLNVPTSSAALP